MESMSVRHCCHKRRNTEVAQCAGGTMFDCTSKIHLENQYLIRHFQSPAGKGKYDRDDRVVHCKLTVLNNWRSFF